MAAKKQSVRRAESAEACVSEKPAAKPRPTEEILAFSSAAEWHKWLEANHNSSPAVYLRIPKGNGRAFGYADALDAALVWGWIDSQKRALDAAFFLQRFGPRTSKSPWSKINRSKIEVLISAGKMQAPGLVEVARAKADGRWQQAYDGARTSSVPEDLAAAFAKNAQAHAFFEKLDGANRYAILWRVQTAKKAETRSARIEKFVAMCSRGERIHPLKQKV